MGGGLVRHVQDIVSFHRTERNLIIRLSWATERGRSHEKAACIALEIALRVAYAPKHDLLGAMKVCETRLHLVSRVDQG